MPYQTEVDIVGEPSNREAVLNLRAEFAQGTTPGTRIRVTVLELEGPGGGNPFVRLTCQSRTRLERWLKQAGYDEAATVTPVDNSKRYVGRR